MSANPVIGVLSLQGGVSEHLHALESAGASAVLVRRPQDVAGVDGLVIPGGESTVIDKLSRVFEVDGPIRERIAAGLPVYGSCAGMIMLADELADAAAGQRTFGGLDVLVRRNAFGRQVESFEEDLPFSGLAGAGLDDAPVRAAFIRAPWVERVGEDVEVLARVTEGPAAGVPVAVRQGVLLATSFHPEITGDHRVHALFVHLVRSA